MLFRQFLVKNVMLFMLFLSCSSLCSLISPVIMAKRAAAQIEIIIMLIKKLNIGREQKQQLIGYVDNLLSMFVEYNIDRNDAMDLLSHLWAFNNLKEISSLIRTVHLYHRCDKTKNLPQLFAAVNMKEQLCMFYTQKIM